jgi:hypothetical protein
MSRFKGAVALPVKWEDGEDETFTLLLDFNALCLLEDPLPGITSGQVDLKSFKTIRLVFWAALQAHHPGLTEEDAGQVLWAIGVEKGADYLQQGFEAAFGTAEGGASTANPPKPRPSATKKR